MTEAEKRQIAVTLTQEEVDRLLGAEDTIYSIIGYAQGREARYALRREQFKLIQFPGIKEEQNVR